MNVEELPSQVIAKELRTKSVENNRKTKRSRMGNYLQGVPNNKQNKTNEAFNDMHKGQSKINRNIILSNQKDYSEIERSIDNLEKYDKTPGKLHSINQAHSTSMIHKTSSRSRANLKIK